MTTLTLADVHALHEKVRAERPLVHNITNFVAMTIAANVLLAAGASPMIDLHYWPTPNGWKVSIALIVPASCRSV